MTCYVFAGSDKTHILKLENIENREIILPIVDGVFGFLMLNKMSKNCEGGKDKKDGNNRINGEDGKDRKSCASEMRIIQPVLKPVLEELLKI